MSFGSSRFFVPKKEEIEGTGKSYYPNNFYPNRNFEKYFIYFRLRAVKGGLKRRPRLLIFHAGLEVAGGSKKENINFFPSNEPLLKILPVNLLLVRPFGIGPSRSSTVAYDYL